MKQAGKTHFLIAFGWLCVVLGVIGIFLPLLPTTPFLLVASWAFARSSPRFHYWLMTHKHLGPIISQWQEGKGLQPRVAIRIAAYMVITFSISIYFVPYSWLKIALVIGATAILVHLWYLTRLYSDD